MGDSVRCEPGTWLRGRARALVSPAGHRCDSMGGVRFAADSAAMAGDLAEDREQALRSRDARGARSRAHMTRQEVDGVAREVDLHAQATLLPEPGYRNTRRLSYFTVE